MIPRPGLARIPRRRVGAICVVVEIDADVIAVGLPVEYVSLWIIDRRA